MPKCRVWWCSIAKPLPREWTGLMLRTARAAQADELRRIPFLRGYLGQVARKPARIVEVG